MVEKYPITAMDAKHLSLAELESSLEDIRRSPRDEGKLHLIVRRPDVNRREVLDEAELDLRTGLVGDTWSARGSSRTADGSPHPEMQLNLMNSRVIALIAGDRNRWALAGDQLYVDLDLSASNLPPGSRLSVGSAIIEVTSQPHAGCQKFRARFGPEALQFVNSPVGRDLHLRGINAKVVCSGRIRSGEFIRKLPPPT